MVAIHARWQHMKWPGVDRINCSLVFQIGLEN